MLFNTFASINLDNAIIFKSYTDEHSLLTRCSCSSSVLSRLNFDCVTVENGKLAVEAILNENFDVVLMDIMMPVMNGYEATLAIRNLDDVTKKDIPIIALSAIVTGSVIETCNTTGIDAYLSKPFDINELYNTIIEMVENAK